MKTGLQVISVLLCGAARATEYQLPQDGSSVIGTETQVLTRKEDTLVDIAHGYDIGYDEIARANPGVDLWLPPEGTSIVLPSQHILPPGPREGIVINLPEHRLYYYPPVTDGQPPVVLTFPVNIGRLDRGSPIGVTHVTAKLKNPTWYPPASIRKEHREHGDPIPAAVPPGPRNPLGTLEMRLAAGRGTYLIHGTNTPWAIGMAITHGCISMYPEDVAALYQRVPVGTHVWLINAPVKVAHVRGGVLIEAHPPLPREDGEPSPELLTEDLEHILGPEVGSLDEGTALKTIGAASGVATPVREAASWRNDLPVTQAPAAARAAPPPRPPDPPADPAADELSLSSMPADPPPLPADPSPSGPMPSDLSPSPPPPDPEELPPAEQYPQAPIRTDTSPPQHLR